MLIRIQPRNDGDLDSGSTGWSHGWKCLHLRARMEKNASQDGRQARWGEANVLCRRTQPQGRRKTLETRLYEVA
jgi:hypothetical protein